MEQASTTQKIAIVEDNKALAEIYKTRLELLGYTCLVANDGIAALYLIQNELPSLVLLDLMVPAVAGDEILRRMRTSDWGKDIPVFIISNLNETEAPAGLRELNIVGYVVKANLSDDGLDKIVNSILRPTDSPQPPLSVPDPSYATPTSPAAVAEPAAASPPPAPAPASEPPTAPLPPLPPVAPTQQF